MSTDQHRHKRRHTHWPPQLAPIGAIRFARRSSRFAETVGFYRDLVGLPLYETFGDSYGSNGAIFGLPSWNLTMEIVEAVETVQVDHHEQLCLYFPDPQAQHAALTRLLDAGVEPVEQHPYWAATGAVTFRDPDGREIVFAPFVFGVNEPENSGTSGTHEFPSG
ncbi:glyoxalase [Mycobacterium mantenii]|uniref:VOC family protein n=1 Tax=Mycobacterium mantenii TaxID=560555 RepID=UPI0007FB7769|nr:VOC family protein [Mycobacterium mantenii]OBH60949.1 glyoxalase [Mycobacterium mantenii]OBH69704.1 glyoxalase [Mycobacterium mantenii]